MAGWISQGESFFKVTLSEIGQQKTRNEIVEWILIESKSSSLSAPTTSSSYYIYYHNPVRICLELFESKKFCIFSHTRHE